MATMRKKYIVVVLMTFLGLGAIANAAPSINACPPKKCCCSTGSLQMMEHNRPMMMEHSVPMHMETPLSCAPKESAPCCELKADQQPIYLAVSAVSQFDHYRTFAVSDASELDFETPEAQASARAYPDDGWLKIPIVPIYLQTLSILC